MSKLNKPKPAIEEPTPKEVYDYDTMYRGFSLLRLIRYWVKEFKWRREYWRENL